MHERSANDASSAAKRRNGRSGAEPAADALETRESVLLDPELDFASGLALRRAGSAPEPPRFKLRKIESPGAGGEAQGTSDPAQDANGATESGNAGTGDEKTDGSATPDRAIVDDGAQEKLEPGQMTRSQFIARFRAEATEVARDAMGPVLSIVGLPALEPVFAELTSGDAAAVENRARSYAKMGATKDAASYLPGLCAAVRTAVVDWVDGKNDDQDGGDRPAGDSAASTSEARDDAEASRAADPADLPVPGAAGAPPGVQRKRATDSGAERGSPADVMTRLGRGHRGGGVAERIGAAMGQSFSDVEFHTDARAARIADEQGALAFTVGQHVAFAAGQYRPGTVEGDAILAHELAHVVQQRGARAHAEDGVRRLDGGEGAEEREADAVAAGVLGRLHGTSTESLPPVIAPGAGLRLRRCTKISELKKDPKDAEKEDKMNEDVRKTMKDANKRPDPHNPLSGVHYWFNFKKALEEAHQHGDAMDIQWEDSMKTGWTKATTIHKSGERTFTRSEGADASVALSDWLKGPTIAECATVLTASAWTALLNELGKDAFNEHFGKAGQAKGKSGNLVIGQSYPPALSDVSGEQRADLRPGIHVYFKNDPDYIYKHPLGSWSGENAVYDGKDANGNARFVGFGASKTQDEMYDTLAQEYDLPRTPEEEAEVKRLKENAAKRHQDFDARYEKFAPKARKDKMEMITKGGFSAEKVRELKNK